MAELRQAGLAEEQVAALLEIYREMREAEESSKGEGKKGLPNPEQTTANVDAPATATQNASMAGQKVGGLALGVISRLLTVLQLMYEVGVGPGLPHT